MRVFSAQEVMRIANVSKTTFDRHVKQGKVNVFYVGRFRRITTEELHKYLRRLENEK